MYNKAAPVEGAKIEGMKIDAKGATNANKVKCFCNVNK